MFLSASSSSSSSSSTPCFSPSCPVLSHFALLQHWMHLCYVFWHLVSSSTCVTSQLPSQYGNQPSEEYTRRTLLSLTLCCQHQAKLAETYSCPIIITTIIIIIITTIIIIIIIILTFIIINIDLFYRSPNPPTLFGASCGLLFQGCRYSKCLDMVNIAKFT